MDEHQINVESLAWVRDYIVLPDRHLGKMVFLKRDHISKMSINIADHSISIVTDGSDATVDGINVPFVLKKISDPGFEQEAVFSALQACENSDSLDGKAMNRNLKRYLLGADINEPEDHPASTDEPDQSGY